MILYFAAAPLVIQLKTHRSIAKRDGANRIKTDGLLCPDGDVKQK
jgi:hypothetical protein